MALSFLDSQVQMRSKSILVQENWMDHLDKEVGFEVDYAHSIRKATTILETESSNRDSQEQMNPTVLTWDRREKEHTAQFTGAELFWSNKIRRMALIEGIHNYVPKALYLMRPETAYAACIHYLAKEIGGAKAYMQQRQFIFNNPGITLYMEKFWTKLQEIYWSGGMSPGLTTNEKTEIVCALIECYCYSQADQGSNDLKCLPVPHLQTEMLERIGVHIPPTEEEGHNLTTSALEKVKKDLSRANLPGIPTLLTAYLQCDACNVIYNDQNQLMTHRGTKKCLELTTCNGCAVKFRTSQDYMIHRISFCRQGPLTGTRCPVCNTPGPRCICQQHWARTYGMVSQIWENDLSETAWLTKDPRISGVLQLAKPLLGIALVEETDEATRPPGPTLLKITEWEKQQRLLPKQYHIEGDTAPKVKLPGDKHLDLNKLISAIQTTHNIQLTEIESTEKVESPPQSIKKELTVLRHKYNRTLTALSRNPRAASEHETNELKQAVEELSQLTTNAQATNELAERLGVDLPTLQENMTALENWAAAAENNFKDKETQQLPHHLNMSSGQSSREQLEKPSNRAFRFEEQTQTLSGLIVNNQEDQSNNEKKYIKNKEKENPETTLYSCCNEDHQKESPPYRSFATAREKEAHLSRSHRCPFKESQGCTFYYEFQAELGKHLQSRHPRNDDSHCGICNDKVPLEHLETHMEQIHIKCPSCKKWYSNPIELRKHWDTTGGACQDPITAANLIDKKSTPQAPDTITLANLSEGAESTDNYVASAIIELANTVFPNSQAGKDKIQELTEKMRAHSFHTQRKAAIAKNPYTAQSQASSLLKKTCFNHPTECKERAIDKVLEKTSQIDLSVQTKNRLENFLTMSNLNQEITALTKQLYLREQAATFLLASSLGETCKQTLLSVYGRPATDLSYNEVLSCLQRHFYNIDLADFRESIRTMKRAQGEPLIKFYNRAFRLADIGAANFEDGPKQEWIENLMRELIYRALDINLKSEVDTLETVHAYKMDSRDLLRMHTDRSNFRAPALEADDAIMNIGLISEKKPYKRDQTIRLISRRDNDNTQKKTFKTKTYEGTKKYPQANIQQHKPTPQNKVRMITRSGLNTNERKENTWKTPYTSQTRQAEANKAPIQHNVTQRQSYNQQSDRSRYPSARQGQYNQNTRNDRKDTTAWTRKTRDYSKPYDQAAKLTRVEATQLMMKKLKLTNEMSAKVGLHCWACGAGRAELGGEYHKRNKCKFPFFKGDPHECKRGVFLMHEGKLCPYNNTIKKRVSRIKMED